MRASSQRARRRGRRLFSLFLWTLAGLFLLPLLYVANASLLGDWELNLHLQEIRPLHRRVFSAPALPAL